MSVAATRTALQAALATATGYTTYDHVPDSLDSTGVNLVVEPAENYVTRSDTFAHGEVVVSIDVWVLVPSLGENETSLNTLDDALEAVMAAMPREWLHNTTSKPMSAESGEWSLYGCRLSVETTTTLS